MQVGVHAGVQDADAAELVQFLRMRLEVEGAGDQDVEAGVGGLTGGIHEVGTTDGAVFGADEDAGTARGLAFLIAALGGDPLTVPRRQAVEEDAISLVLLVDAGLRQVLDDGLVLVLGLLLERRESPGGGVHLVDQLAMLVYGLGAVGRQAFRGERPGDADALTVLIGRVVETFVVGTGGDGGVDFRLPGDAGLPERLQGGDGGRVAASHEAPCKALSLASAASALRLLAGVRLSKMVRARA